MDAKGSWIRGGGVSEGCGAYWADVKYDILDLLFERRRSLRT